MLILLYMPVIEQGMYASEKLSSDLNMSNY